MRKALFFISLVLFSCNKSESDRGKAEKPLENIDERNPLEKLEKDFKFRQITEFEIDTFTWETRPGNYKELNSETFKLIFQDSKREFIGKESDRDYLYSWQTKDPDLIELVILTQDESSYCDLLQYCVFDKNGKALDRFIIAAQCGDGGWSYQSTGKALAENKFQVESIEFESELIGSENQETIEGDSIITAFTISKKGRILKEEISKKHFRKTL